ncbi:MAG TPA: 30S ribosomal protein S6, partial [Oligoflexia bacterium]|nr:30S ribosomal protein S6 [Oligoflexia bacterium]
MLKKYEVVVVLDTDLDDEGVKQQMEKIEATVAAHSGAVEVRDVWGRKQLAYPIKKKQSGIFVLLVVTGDNRLVSDLKRQLRINDAVLRSFIVRKDKFAPDFAERARSDNMAPEVSSVDERRLPES